MAVHSKRWTGFLCKSHPGPGLSLLSEGCSIILKKKTLNVFVQKGAPLLHAPSEISSPALAESHVAAAQCKQLLLIQQCPYNLCLLCF